MTMKSVGKAALKMVEEVRRQFREDPGLLTGLVLFYFTYSCNYFHHL